MMTDEMTDDRRAGRVPRPGRPEGPRSAAAVTPRCRPAGQTPDTGDELTGLEVTVSGRRGGPIVAEIAGEIDLRTAEQLRTRLIELSDAGHDLLIVDFAGVRFCDASGLGTLVAAYNHVHARGGEIRLARVRTAQRRLFHITGLDRLFPMHETVAGATGARSSLS